MTEKRGFYSLCNKNDIYLSKKPDFYFLKLRSFIDIMLMQGLKVWYYRIKEDEGVKKSEKRKWLGNCLKIDRKKTETVGCTRSRCK